LWLLTPPVQQLLRPCLEKTTPTALFPDAEIDGTLLALAWLVHEISISHAPY